MHFLPASCISFILAFSRYPLMTYVKIPHGSGAKMAALGNAILTFLPCLLDDSRSSNAFDALHILCCPLVYRVFNSCC